MVQADVFLFLLDDFTQIKKKWKKDYWIYT